MGKTGCTDNAEGRCCGDCHSTAVSERHGNDSEGCARINYGERMDLLPKCHVVVSATASPNFTLTRNCSGKRIFTHDIIFIDLAVPRDIEPAIGEMEHVTLYDIDDFQITAVGDYLKDSSTRLRRFFWNSRKNSVTG